MTPRSYQAIWLLGSALTTVRKSATAAAYCLLFSSRRARSSVGSSDAGVLWLADVVGLVDCDPEAFGVVEAWLAACGEVDPQAVSATVMISAATVRPAVRPSILVRRRSGRPPRPGEPASVLISPTISERPSRYRDAKYNTLSAWAITCYDRVRRLPSPQRVLAYISRRTKRPSCPGKEGSGHRASAGKWVEVCPTERHGEQDSLERSG
jgi:hypothetical protein